MTLSRLELLVNAAEHLTASGIPVLPVKAGAKAPIPHPDTGSWWVIDDPDDIRPIFDRVIAQYTDASLALIAGRAKSSPVLAVDIDGPTGFTKAQELGVTSGADVWVQRTGGGGWHIFYFHEDGLELHRRVKPQGVALDLIVDGYALVPPSVTKGPYRWQPGHSPSDIGLADLAPPPAALVAWWLEVQGAAPAAPQGVSKGHSACSLLGAPIPQGQRNDALCRIAGWLRLYHPEPVVSALLLCINDARCSPEPLPQEEVAAIARSVCRYPQTGVNGHPLAVVPSFQRAVLP